MNKVAKRLIVSAMSAAMAFSTMTMSASAAQKITVPKSVTVYTSNPVIRIDGAGATSKTTIKKSSVKSSKKSVAGILSLDTNKSSSSYKYEPFYKGGKAYTSKSSNSSQTIYLEAKKPGKTNVSFKIGSTSYTTKVTVKKYVNPVKKITLTGVNKGKNFASKTKNASFAELKLSKSTVKNAKLSVTAASGWYVDYAYISYGNANNYRNYSFSGSKSSGSFSLGADVIKKGGYIYLTLVNKQNGASIYLSYELK